MQNEDQNKMDFDVPEIIDSNWYVPLNRNNLIAVLAGGILSPNKFYTDYDEDLQRFCDDGILLIRKGLSHAVVENEELTGSSGYTVLAEISIKSYPKTKVRGLTNQGKACKASLTSDTDETRILSFPGIIPVTRIIAIHFGSDSDKSNFIARSFDNLPADIVPLKVTKKLFNQDVSEAIIDGIKNFTDKKSRSDATELNALYKQSDSFVGSAVLLAATFSPTENWLNLLKDTLVSKQPDGLSYIEASQIITNRLELSLFREAYSMLINMDPEDGWQAKKILSDIYTAVNIGELSKDEHIQLERWQSTCIDILDNRRSITPLTDSKMKVGRALLLLLLRPDPEDLIDSAHSSLEPGTEVLSLAAILAGARSGFEALSNSLKSLPVRYNLYSNLKADLINSNWKTSLLKKHNDGPEIKLALQEWGVMGQNFQLFVNDEKLVEKKDEGSLELRTVLNKSEAAGIQLKYEREQHRLSYRYEFKNDRSQTVYVSIGVENENNDKTIRFWSPCLDVSNASGKKLFNAAMKQKLLEKNCEMHIYCRFAFCKQEKAILVIHDQILDTMDQSELCSGLKHVAITADEFENELGFDSY